MNGWLDHGAIVSFTPRNLFTVVVMVTIGWFIIHLFATGFNTLQDYLDDAGGEEDITINTTGAGVSANVTY